MHCALYFLNLKWKYDKEYYNGFTELQSTLLLRTEKFAIQIIVFYQNYECIHLFLKNFPAS